MDVLLFSGGKDSLACLHLLREKWDALVVLWINAGAPWDQTTAFMEKIRKEVPHFQEITSDVLTQNSVFGVPADIVPIVSSLPGQAYRGRNGPLVQSWLNCCAMNIWNPSHYAIMSLKPNIVYIGQRREEKYKSFTPNGTVFEGIRIVYPIETWTADQVDDFLLTNGIEIPEFYEWSDKSLDCWHCTAYLEERKRQIQWLEENDPGKYRIVKENLRKIKDSSQIQLDYVNDLLGR